MSESPNEMFRRLEAGGWRRVEKRSGKYFWEEPHTGRHLPEDSAMARLREEEARRLTEAGWEAEEIEGETYWRNPESGRLYPRGAAFDVLEKPGGGS